MFGYDAINATKVSEQTGINILNISNKLCEPTQYF